MRATAFEFISMQEPRLTARLARVAAAAGATVVLDLEDSLWDVTDERRTASLKEGGRANLLAMVGQHAALFAHHPLGVRVNRLPTVDARRDIEALADASAKVSFAVVIATKVESAGDLSDWAAALSAEGVAYRELVPIVETVAGLDNLDDILTGAPALGVRKVVYGHYDYALDAGWWPFPDHDEVAFWHRVAPLIQRIEQAGVDYVHPPFFQLYSGDTYAGILGRLYETCRRAFGVITLGRRQTKLVEQLEHGAEMPAGELRDVLADAESLADRARHVVAAFLGNKRPGTSFAVDGRSGEFISPHLYLAARKYLDGIETGRAAG